MPAFYLATTTPSILFTPVYFILSWFSGSYCSDLVAYSPYPSPSLPCAMPAGSGQAFGGRDFGLFYLLRFHTAWIILPTTARVKHYASASVFVRGCCWTWRWLQRAGTAFFAAIKTAACVCRWFCFYCVYARAVFAFTAVRVLRRRHHPHPHQPVATFASPSILPHQCLFIALSVSIQVLPRITYPSSPFHQPSPHSFLPALTLPTDFSPPTTLPFSVVVFVCLFMYSCGLGSLPSHVPLCVVLFVLVILHIPRLFASIFLCYFTFCVHLPFRIHIRAIPCHYLHDKDRMGHAFPCQTHMLATHHTPYLYICHLLFILPAPTTIYIYYFTGSIFIL